MLFVGTFFFCFMFGQKWAQCINKSMCTQENGRPGKWGHCLGAERGIGIQCQRILKFLFNHTVKQRNKIKIFNI